MSPSLSIQFQRLAGPGDTSQMLAGYAHKIEAMGITLENVLYDVDAAV
jgi:hypothetical protein